MLSAKSGPRETRRVPSAAKEKSRPWDGMAAAKPLPTVPDSPVSTPAVSVGGREGLPISPRDELARSLSPLIAVVASPDAESLCQANNIPSFVDYIRPFGENVEGRVSPRDWQGVPIPIDNFKIRFRDINKLDEPNHQAMLRLVDDYVRSSAVEEAEPMIKTAADVNDSYLDKSLDELTPWYSYFRNTMLSLRGITEHETFDHPVAVFIVVTSNDPDPMSTTMQLYNPNIPSFTVDKPYVDPNILRYHIVLHDPQRASEEQAQTTFEKMRRTLGLNCHLLRINSKPRTNEDLLGDQEITKTQDENSELISNIWRDMLNEAYIIDSKLAAYANNNNSATSVAGEYSGPIPQSPAQSSHTRTSSVSSNVSSLQGAAMHATNLQATSLVASLESLEPKEESLQVDVFADTTATPPPVQYGKCLSFDDIHAAKAMVREFVVQSLIPFMERNIQLWNEQVASARRGLTGRLFGASRRLFGSSSRSPSNQSLTTIPASGPNLPTGVNQVTVYPFGAPEAQMRKLADYAFMIRDYKFAHTIYDTVRRDYATDKAYKYHAGTQEMIGICLLMMNQPLRSKVDADRNFELAVQQYLGRCRTPFHATRTTVIYYELLKAHRMWKEVPTALVRMTGEDSDLRSALFLEQAAHCFLHVSRPMVRKYGFHVVMAAHRYGKASQRKHAFRCYKMASLIYADHDWSIATSHIQFALGRQAFHLGRLEDAALAFANMLANDKQTSQQQVAHVREFLFIYRQYTNQAGIDPRKESLPKLALPVIDPKSIHVQLSNAQPQQDYEEDWLAMERELVEENIATGIIYGSKKTLALQQQSDNRAVCAIGEPAVVSLELYNPLQIPISFNDIILGCEYRESMKPFKGSRDAEVEAYETMIEGTPIEDTSMIDFGHFELEKLAELTLEPLEKRVVNLSLLPKHEGSILVKGLHYTFNNLVHSFRPIIKRGKRLNDTLEQRQSIVYGEDYTLDILVTSPMPLLDVAFHGVPESMLSGEVVQTVLEINNKGNKGLTALRMKSSHPSFLCVGRPEEMDKSIYSSAESNEDQGETYQVINKLYDPSVISIPLPGGGDDDGRERGVIAPGMTTLIPLWIRGDRIGKHTFKLLFSYQSEHDNPAIAHRTLRYSIQVQVLPSLKINAFTRPSAATPSEYILGIEIENLQTVAGFQLKQISAASTMWTVVPLSIQMQSISDITSKTNIPPRQTTFSYYKIRKISGDDFTQQQEYDPETHPINLQISKLTFGPSGIPFDTVPLKVFAMNSRTHWRYGQLQMQHHGMPASEHIEYSVLYNPGDVDLTLYWNIPNMKRHGHHYIIGINLNDTPPAPAIRRGSVVSNTQPHLPVAAA